MRRAVAICLLCCFSAAPPARAALVPAATGSRQHVSAAQPLDTSLQPIAFGQTEFNSTGGSPGVATQSGLYLISGALTTTTDAAFAGSSATLTGAVFVNGENRGDFTGVLTPGSTDQAAFSVLTQLNPGDQIEVRAAGSISGGATQVLPLGNASHLQVTAFNTAGGTPAAAATRQHLISSQVLSGSAQTIQFDQTDLNTTGGGPAVATRAGLYRITGALVTTTDESSPNSGALVGNILVNGVNRGDFYGGLVPGVSNRTTFSLLTQLQPGDQVEVRAASTLGSASQVLASGSATHLQITSFATFDNGSGGGGLPAVSAARQHVTAEQFIGNSPQIIAFGQTGLTTLGAVPTIATQAGLYEISGTLTTFDADTSVPSGVLTGQILINGIDRGDFAGALTRGGIDQTTFSLLTPLNPGDQIAIQASANTPSAIELLNVGSGSNLEIIRYNEVPEPGSLVTLATAGLLLRRRRHRTEPRHECGSKGRLCRPRPSAGIAALGNAMKRARGICSAGPA